jgi:hypothetical protein
MKLVGGLTLVVLAVVLWLPTAGTPTTATADFAEGGQQGTRPKAITDGRLSPGRLETMRVAGFPGKGVVEVSFFPTAICEDGCGARSFRVGKTNARGTAKFRVRVPGTFFNIRERHVYFRDGERIDVNVTWEGPGHSFAVASADPEPILVRRNGNRDD